MQCLYSGNGIQNIYFDWIVALNMSIKTIEVYYVNNGTKSVTLL